MTPKDIKKRHPGYQVKSSKSASNDYHLLIALKGISSRADIDIWDHMCKPSYLRFSVYKNSTRSHNNNIIYLDDKEVKAGRININSVGQEMIKSVFKD